MKTKPLWRIRYYIEGAPNLSYTTVYQRGENETVATEALRKTLKQRGQKISSVRSVDYWQ